MVAQRVRNGFGKVGTVIRQQHPNLVCASPKARNGVCPVLPAGYGSQRFFRGRFGHGDAHAGHGQLAFVIQAVIVGIQEAASGNGTGPHKADVFLGFICPVVDLNGFRSLCSALPRNDGAVVAALCAVAGEHHAVRRIRRQRVSAGAHMVKNIVSVAVADRFIVQLILDAVQRDPHPRQQLLAGGTDAVRQRFQPAESADSDGSHQPDAALCGTPGPDRDRVAQRPGFRGQPRTAGTQLVMFALLAEAAPFRRPDPQAVIACRQVLKQGLAVAVAFRHGNRRAVFIFRIDLHAGNPDLIGPLLAVSVFIQKNIDQQAACIVPAVQPRKLRFGRRRRGRFRRRSQRRRGHPVCRRHRAVLAVRHCRRFGRLGGALPGFLRRFFCF